MRRACGVFLVAFRKALWSFPRKDRDFKEFRGFPGMELGPHASGAHRTSNAGREVSDTRNG